ncbi:hypothetical protein Ctaglu_14610 [Clostridium tagluense]|uniref:Uncharacterized protein n=1 Tax=Clostridium tagluense TaxID=360422 RepID=A0A401UJY4_9CLOT|nr:hypothetical protein Ctaglu_14610 [Clostridium tagluense]
MFTPLTTFHKGSQILLYMSAPTIIYKKLQQEHKSPSEVVNIVASKMIHGYASDD